MLSTAEKSTSIDPQPLLTYPPVPESVVARVPIARGDILLFSLVVIYVSSIYLVEAAFGLQGMVHIQWNYRFLNIPTLVFCVAVLVMQLIKQMLQLPPGTSRWGTALRELRQEYFSGKRIVGCVIIYLSFPVFMSAFTSMKQMIPEVHSFAWDSELMQIDFMLHGSHHPGMVVHKLLGYPIVTRVLDCCYMAWFIFLYGFSLWMAASSRRHLRLQYFLCLGLVWVVLGNLLATIFSSVGPCYFANVVPETNPYVSQLVYLQSVHDKYFLWAIATQEELWFLYSNKMLAPFGGISAMPSIHVAGATLFALAGWKAHRWLGGFFIGYLVVIQISSIHLGWHYAVDGYLSIVLTYILWTVVGYGLSTIESRKFSSPDKELSPSDEYNGKEQGWQDKQNAERL